MPTERVDPNHPDPAVLERAAELLRHGRLVAFPTETVYGLGAHALDPDAVQRIYAAKGRPSFNPLIVHLSSARDADRVVAQWPDVAHRLAQAFWPGPLTLVLPKQPVVPDQVTAGLGTVAVRVPSHPVALALLRASGLPLAAPSANRSTRISPTSAQHVEKALGDRVDLILDAGPTSVGIESTVLDLSQSPPVLLRPGSISRETLEQVVGAINLPAAMMGAHAPRPSPGMMQRHYAPRGRVVLAADGEDATAARAIRDAHGRGERAGAIMREGATIAADHVVTLPDHPDEYAREFYAALHSLEDAGCALIIIQRPPDESRWAGVRDRVERAAG